MIGYLTIGTNDIKKASAFYDELLNQIGAARAFQTDDLTAWRFGENSTLFTVTKPHDKETATTGNGVMVAFSVESIDLIDKLYQQALQLGATNEGEPGERGKNFYAAYLRDLDGNKFNFYCYT